MQPSVKGANQGFSDTLQGMGQFAREIGLHSLWPFKLPSGALTPLLALIRVGFSGERQGGGVEGLPSIRERSFKPSTCPVESY
jgi:hypothetical protein